MLRHALISFTFAFAAIAANITFQADFEKTVEAIANGGKVTPKFVGDNVGMFDKGISGDAVKIGPWPNMQTPETTDAADRNFGYE